MGVDLGEMKLGSMDASTPRLPDLTTALGVLKLLVSAAVYEISFIGMFHAAFPAFCNRLVTKLLGKRRVLLMPAVLFGLLEMCFVAAFLLCLAVPVVIDTVRSGAAGDSFIAVAAWVEGFLGLFVTLYLTASSATPHLASTAAFSLSVTLASALIALGENSFVFVQCYSALNFHGMLLAVSRLWMLEAWAMRSFCGKACVYAVVTLMACGQLYQPPAFFKVAQEFQWWLMAVAYCPTMVGLLAFSLHGMGKAARMAEGMAAKGSGLERMGAAMLRTNFRTLLPCIGPFTLRILIFPFLGALEGAPYEVTEEMEAATKWIWVATQLPQELGNFFAALLLSGALTGAAAQARKDLRKAWRSQQRRRRALQAPKGTEGDACEKDWEGKVEELAGRGISLEALLRFYKELPENMPHFDESRHTTADVVRQAIIPMSAPERLSMSEVLMKGKRTVPGCMVTHNWSNLFRDLLAAVLVDALEEAEFENVTFLLRERIDVLEHWLQAAGVSQKTYWICAFSVNQHRGICGAVSANSADSVTGIPHPICECSEAKVSNTTPPLLQDGRSVGCEMNKFREMIRMLSEQNPDFKQVVAVDGAFQIFSRAWCVAELAMAHELGMVQSLKVLSIDALGSHAERLRELRMQDMKASRPEDKEEIMKKISDVEAFNATLQRLLFEDLFPAWQNCDAEARAKKGGQMLRWHCTLPKVFGKP